ncbi:hypothetical protein [Aliiroseovarius crassostreae]|uniref:hypothetical protein n=1 Tax=Aliiroseovarius crassostreae TaxID=154981 RepID=UPI00220171AF|nr:hypothetical protein [Aliiroseovarius crassostreae]UWQ07923.1 hypothetical protein K3X25_14505 [Aliiroseovarius crassostreae]
MKTSNSTSNAAYELRGLIAVVLCAFENDTNGIEMNARGISSTLEIAERKAEELIGACEDLEKVQRCVADTQPHLQPRQLQTS